MESFDRDYFTSWSSTYFHRRVIHLTALQALRLGAWSAVMAVHHKGRATTSEEPARPPIGGSLFVATGGRRRRLTMSRHRRRDVSYPVAAKRRSYVLPSYESKYSARAAWRGLSIGKGAQRRHGGKEPGHRSRQNGPSGASRRSPDVHRASRRSYPRDRFAAIKSLPAGRIVLWEESYTRGLSHAGVQTCVRWRRDA